MTYIKAGVIAGLVCFLGACETTDNAMRRQQSAWLGRSLESFIEHHSLVVENAYRDSYGQPTFIFRMYAPYGSCGITIKTVTGDYERDQRISEMTSTCPPGKI